jgi:hypothetical protein
METGSNLVGVRERVVEIQDERVFIWSLAKQLDLLQ